MSSASKTLDLLSHFSATQPEIGLSEFCRLAKRDKATTYRHLQTLEATGFIEQNPDSKKYRLGPILLQLAQVREATVPRKQGALPTLTDLACATGETAHASVLSGTTLYALAACYSDAHSTRVIIDIDTFPLHATASGLCALSFGPASLLDAALPQMTRYTDKTPMTPTALRSAIARTQHCGIARSAGNFQSDTHSFAAPLFDAAGLFAGAVTVACVTTRLTETLETDILQHLTAASRQISYTWGGSVPALIEHAWASAPDFMPEQDIAS